MTSVRAAGARSRLLPALLAGGLLAGLPGFLAAQERIEPVDSLRQIQSISPRSGPPGTLVQVYTDNMPLEARFHVGVGATRSGFEALYEADQLGLGEISVTLPIPESVSHERALVFVAFNAVFSPIAMSRPFHVTDERGLLRRTGVVQASRPECLAFRDEDGWGYQLVGAVEGLAPAEEVVLEARYEGESSCLDGARIRVVSAAPAPPG